MNTKGIDKLNEMHEAIDKMLTPKPWVKTLETARKEHGTEKDCYTMQKKCREDGEV